MHMHVHVHAMLFMLRAVVRTYAQAPEEVLHPSVLRALSSDEDVAEGAARQSTALMRIKPLLDELAPGKPVTFGTAEQAARPVTL